MKKFILIGNPNTGKTTLYNNLTHSNEHIGNWHGVTVGVIEKKFKVNGEECLLVDLPGVYSLDYYSMEERISLEYLEKNKDATVINICDANNIERNLLLTLELINMGLSVVVAMNMYKENKNLDIKKLSNELQIPVINVDAINKKSVNKFIKEVIESNISKGKLVYKYNSIEDKYRQINNITTKVVTRKKQSDKLGFIDRIVLNKWLFLPIFIIVISIVFYLTFATLGAFLSGVLGDLFSIILKSVLSLIEANYGQNWFYFFIADGIFGGILSVLSFLPQIGLLFFCFGFLEDVGYLPRVAFMLDGLLKKVGMTGKSLFSLLMGFGCTATAMLTTRNLDNIKLKKRTALVLPFMSCSAKLPVLLVFASAFFLRFKVLFLVLLYFMSIILGIIVSSINAKINKNTENNYFILELPKYRLPKFKRLVCVAFSHIKSFVLKVGSVILVSSIIIWILQNFSFDFKFVAGDNEHENMLASISNFLYPIFKPLGFSSSLVVAVLLSGLIGKEMVISTIGILNSVSISGLSIQESISLATSPVNFTIQTAIAFIVFVMLYSPCISVFEVTSRELGYKFALSTFAFQFALAYLISYIVYSIVTKNIIVISILALIVLALFIGFVLKLSRRINKPCIIGGCYGCNKSCGSRGESL